VSKKMMVLLASVVVVVLGAAATALAASPSHNNDSATKGNPAIKGNSGHNKDFAGLVEIGGGRKMYMECHGKGSPTVVFVSGAGDRTETWSKTLDSSKQPVLPAIAETNRVCAYDRPGTYLPVGEGPEDFEKSRSDPVPQPTTLHDGARDLHALLSASGERGPYVVVGHSLGGAISRQFASEYPQEVSGLVLIDYTPYDARKDLTAREWEIWSSVVATPPEEALQIYPEIEQADNVANLELVLGAEGVPAPLKPMPLIVLSADEPLDTTPFVEDGTFPTPEEAKEFGELILRATVDARSDLVSQVPGARHITDTDSGHYIHWERPKLVIKQIREVVEAARKKSCALGVKNHGQCVKAENHAQR
jgi:pimeloyl-ACP methyl ester carboxylesterase